MCPPLRCPHVCFLIWQRRGSKGSTYSIDNIKLINSRISANCLHSTQHTKDSRSTMDLGTAALNLQSGEGKQERTHTAYKGTPGKGPEFVRVRQEKPWQGQQFPKNPFLLFIYEINTNGLVKRLENNTWQHLRRRMRVPVTGVESSVVPHTFPQGRS